MPFCKIVLSNSLQTFSFAGSKRLNSLTYSIPVEFQDKVKPGSFVQVPFRNTKENALVLETFADLDEDGFKVRDIEELLTEDSIYPVDLVEMLKYAADYYCCSYQEVLNTALPSKILKKPQQLVTLLAEEADKLSEAEQQVVEALKKARKQEAKFARLKALTGFNTKELKALLKKLESKSLISLSFVTGKKRKSKTLNPLEKFEALGADVVPDLTLEQGEVLKKIREVQQRQVSPKVLLHGVTGSGKTEVYLRLLEDCFRQNKSAIFLVPEISLAPQLVERISQRFGEENVLLWHSILKQSEKEYTWNRLLEKQPVVLVGARSAIFAPVHDLGLIVMDEEHENSYKQDSPAPRYHASKLASQRLESIAGKTLMLYGSATPSVELYYKASSSEYPDYHLTELRERVFQNPLPEVEIVDMREEFAQLNKSIFSRKLKYELTKTLEEEKQSILFLNKRGTASHVFCRNCGYVYKCSNCDSKMVYHADKRLMICHHCNLKEAHPKTCPECSMPSIKFFGLGSQKLEEEVRKEFPEARVARLDSDVSRSEDTYLKVWKDFRDGEIDILVGTQMIAKGLDIDKLQTVGVVAADTNFSQLDYTSEERAFQLLTQVAGRAGRRDDRGKVIFQTYQPERETLRDAQRQDYMDFYTREIEERRTFVYPPYSTLVRFVASAELEHEAIAVVNDFHALLYGQADFKPLFAAENVFGPVPCLIARLSRKYRYQLLFKFPNELANKKELIAQLKNHYQDYRSRIEHTFTIDVDNMSLY